MVQSRKRTDGTGAVPLADLRRLPLSEADAAGAWAGERDFAFRAPASFVARIDWSHPNDPLRRQILPTAAELTHAPGERHDPIGDYRHQPVPRLVHRYPDRVLLFPTFDCAVHCRHCFRREREADARAGFSQELLRPALDYVGGHDAIREVILTGGDPWTLADGELAWLREEIERFSHVRLLRLHTRVPVVAPERVTDEAIEALRGGRMTAVVLHLNHSREIAPPVIDACRRLREAGFLLYSQSVLLRGVNDDAGTLAELFRDVVYELGAHPYYLHHCDLAPGLRHLRTTIDEGQALLRRLRGHVSGLCVPHYVLDLPGGAGKIPLGPCYIEGREAHRWLFRCWQGKQHVYEEVVQGPAHE